jgi:hypothetical protein
MSRHVSKREYRLHAFTFLLRTKAFSTCLLWHAHSIPVEAVTHAPRHDGDSTTLRACYLRSSSLMSLAWPQLGAVASNRLVTQSFCHPFILLPRPRGSGIMIWLYCHQLDTGDRATASLLELRHRHLSLRQGPRRLRRHGVGLTRPAERSHSGRSHLKLSEFRLHARTSMCTVMSSTAAVFV